MGFFTTMFDRTSRVVKGQVNQGLDALEDATFEATLRQSVRDMRTELNSVVRASAEAMSNYNRLSSEYEDVSKDMERWMERARSAMTAGNEDLARKALAKKNASQSRLESIQPALESAEQTSNKLKEHVAKLKRQIEEAERNTSTLIARKNAAAAQKKVAQALAGVGEADNAFAALNAFEESVKREEAQAKAYQEMAIDPDSELEQEFAALDTNSVDVELEALRRELGQ